MEHSEAQEHSGLQSPLTQESSTETDISPPRGNPFPIVGIGASAGGLEAFGQLLASLPSDTGMAFVVVQHLDPQQESLLPELLSSRTAMPVVSVQDGVHVEPDHVYVIPPNTSMELRDDQLRLASRAPELHPPIDIFFRSLARVQGSRAVGVVLSGNASDGSLGIRAIKSECGLTFAQDEVTAAYGSMPRNAVATGAVDVVLSPAGIGKELGVLGHHPYLRPQRRGDSGSEMLPEGDGELKRLFSLLQSATKVDFARYKPTAVRRRIGRRMMVLRMEKLAEYVHYAEQTPSELRELYRDLLISVTSFFRDPACFASLSRLLATAFTQAGGREQPVRVWVPGCATGEEVYSLAICVREVLDETGSTAPIQIFGTDISETALERARNGIYSSTIREDVSEERLRRFFTSVDHGFQVHKSLRESCVFARHDVTRDPPFPNLDLVSCRNVLIYLDVSAQRRVLPIFHYGLKPSGLLMLGTAETIAAAPDLFIPAHAQHRIYSRKEVPGRLSYDTPSVPSVAEQHRVDGRVERFAGTDLQRTLERLIQARYSPDAVLVDGQLQILQFRGHASAYFDPAPGGASLNVLRMARESLVLPLRRTIHAAAETGASVRETGITVETGGQRQEIALEVTPLAGADGGERFYFIVFTAEKEEDRAVRESPSIGPVPVEGQIRMLQRELAESRAFLAKVTEEYEAHAEELRAANEEARSANEELQSTNEELVTTREELQSANEELISLNEELHSRDQELGSTNSDFRNLLTAVTVPILMVDSDLRVRRFNTAAGMLLELGPLDTGRPVGHLRGRIETPRLEEQVRSVIETLQAISEELQDREGRWYSVGIRPYRTVEDRIAGAVITFQDIDPLKRGLQAAEDARDYAEAMIETIREPLLVLDSDLRVQRATPAFYETFLVTREETEGHLLYDLGNGQWNQPRLRELLGAAMFRPFYDFEVQHDFPHIGRRTMRLNGQRMPRSDPQSRMLLLSIEDVTERREIAEIRFQRLFETAKDGIVVVEVETETVLDVNPYFLELTGFSRENFIGRTLREAGRLLGVPEADLVMTDTREQKVARYDDLQLTRRDGSHVSVEVIANRYEVGSQPVIQLNIREITVRKQAVHALRESEERFRLFVESVHDYALFQLDREGRILTWNSGAERLLGWKEDEAVGQSSAIVFVPEEAIQGEHEHELETARKNGRAEDERWHIRKDGSRFFASGVLTQLCDERGNLLGFAKVMRDITSRREQEEQSHRTIEEKNVLVREIHHRVKNNLQVIVSLLSLQSGDSKDPEVLAAFEETEGRVRAIAHIHERLYTSDDLTDVEFSAYLTDLARELVALHATIPDGVLLQVEAKDMVLHIEQATPLGLIANELIVNSLKHGLQGGSGRLQITLDYIEGSFHPELGETFDDGWAEVRIADSGPGLPPGFDLAGTKSMGFRLVNLLVRQLRGQLEIGEGPGANIAVRFPLRNE